VWHGRVVAPTIARGRRWLAVGGSLAAIGFLVAMTLSGRFPESGQFVRFVPAGVVAETPEQIDRIELTTSDRRWAFERIATGWRAEPRGTSVPPALATHLDDSIKFMHVSAPVRVMDRAEWGAQGLKEFGLEPPAYSAALFRGGRRVLTADFGSPNPQKVLQYMRVQGRDQLYLMSRFIGEEWEQALREAAR
jgi:hypothetical protein